jgi:hypothetical protein
LIPWREKFRAFGIHFATTFAVALLAAALIFLVWYPAPFATMIGGFKLFMLVSGTDLALGPLCSLVVYNSRKTRLALWFDYTVIGLIQVSALAYGVYSVSQNRPAFIAFVKDRIEVIAAGEIAEKDILEAKGSKYSAPSLRGPILVATYVKPEDRNDALDGGLAGRDIGVRPKFYVDYGSQLDTIRQHLKPLPALSKRRAEFETVIAEALDDLKRPAEDFGWLPVRHTRGFWTALVDRKTGYPVQYVPIDPY